MKHMIPTITALAALCAGTTNTMNAEPPAAPDAQVTQAAIARAQHEADGARGQVARASEELIRAQRAVELARAQLPVGLAQADRALQLAQATVALAAAADPAEPAGTVEPIQDRPLSSPAGVGAGTGVSSGVAGGMGGGGGGGFGGGGFFARPGRNVGQALIIRAADSNPSTLGEIQEDMSIMSHILIKALADGRGDDAQNLAMGIVVSTLGGDQHPQSLYLDGYGALFLLNARMPLVPPPPTKEVEKKEAPVDTTWEQTKHELYGGGPGPGGSAELPGWRAYQNSFAEMQRRYGLFAPGTQPFEYDAQKVESLKKQLLEALKNATNIRHLKSDEWITVAVNGPGSEHAVVVNRRIRTARSGPAPRSDNLSTSEGADVGAFNGPPREGAGRASTLTIRVKKADVDAFAKGKLSSEEFQRKASIATY